MNAQPVETELRETLLDVVRKLEGKGFNHGSTGNVCCRVGDDFLITPTGANSLSLTARNIVRLKADGSPLGEGIPSSEWHMHLAIMREYPQVNAVVHTHADCCVALSCLRKPIPSFHYMVAGFGGTDIPCADYATFGTPELADSVVAALAGRKACLLASHGMVAIGNSLQAAFDLTVKLETLARQYILACQAGTPVLISDSEMGRVRRQYLSYGTHRIQQPEGR